MGVYVVAKDEIHSPCAARAKKRQEFAEQCETNPQLLIKHSYTKASQKIFTVTSFRGFRGFTCRTETRIINMFTRKDGKALVLLVKFGDNICLRRAVYDAQTNEMCLYHIKPLDLDDVTWLNSIRRHAHAAMVAGTKIPVELHTKWYNGTWESESYESVNIADYLCTINAFATVKMFERPSDEYAIG